MATTNVQGEHGLPGTLDRDYLTVRGFIRGGHNNGRAALDALECLARALSNRVDEDGVRMLLDGLEVSGIRELHDLVKWGRASQELDARCGRGESLVAVYDTSDLSSDERDYLAGEVHAQADRSDGHPSVEVVVS